MKNHILSLQLPALLVCTSGAFTVLADDNAALPYHPFGVNAEAGLTGFGGDFTYRFADHFGARAGMDYFGYSYTGTIKDVNFNAKLRLMSEPLTLDLFPWKSSSFHVSLGAAFNQNQITGDANGSFTLNGNQYNNGSLNLKITQWAVSPYLSLGGNFFYFDSAHQWSLGGEIGAMYTGRPHVTLNGPAIAAADLENERQKIISYANRVQFFPILKLQLGYSF